MSHAAVTIGVRLRVDLGPDCSIGPGKIALLEQIERSGSLSEAARVLKMSYRRGWLLLEDLNRTLGHPVTTASIGGVGGGGAQITPFGRRVVAAFRETERAAAQAAREQLEWLIPTATAVDTAPVAPRRAVTRTLARAGAAVAGIHAADARPAAPQEATAPTPEAKPLRRGKRGRVGKLP
jgi:molybdate transport system regulatory protein